ncbi:MAG: glycosyltransferase [Acidimicrobiales bacterium]
MAEPAISVVIPTFNRARSLERTLAALLHQEDGPAFEVIVVDDGSTDDTAEVVAGHPAVIYLRQPNSGPATARNRGWSRATGGLIAFTDDDTVPDRRWLADLVAAFAERPDLDAVGGNVQPVRLSLLTRFVQAEQHASHGVDDEGRIVYLVTANCAYRRTVLAALGGFDESFPAASGEDSDLTMRAQVAGHRLVLLDDALVLHDHPDRLRPILRTYLKHGRSRRLVVDKNPSPGWPDRRRRVLTADHWLRRFCAYRAAGLGRAASLLALALRLVGLAAYAAGMSQSRRRPPTAPAAKRIRVMVACPGSDHVRRGYERVATELATLLERDPQITVIRVKGSGRSPDSIVLPSMRRDRLAARCISRVLSADGPADAGTRRPDRSRVSLLVRLLRRRVVITAYDVEALSFGLSLLCLTFVRRPDLLVLQDVSTARVLGFGRALPGWRTKLLFVNGAPWPAPYHFADAVQHVTPETWEADPATDWDKALLPLGTNVPDALARDEVAGRRRHFGLPEHGQVVISVGTLLDGHKRHGHLIREVARLPVPRPFLVIAGSPNADQARLARSADELLGSHHKVICVGADEVADLLACADLFVLASLREGFGLVYLEALAAGLPAIVHDHPLQRWLLGPFGTYVDMARSGALADAIAQALGRDERWSLADARRGYVDGRFSWDALRPDYLDLVRRTCTGDR